MPTVALIDVQQNNPACYFNLQWRFICMDEIWKKMYYPTINTVENKKFNRSRKWSLPY